MVQGPLVAVERIALRDGDPGDRTQATSPLFRGSTAQIGAGAGRVCPDDAETRARLDGLVADAGGNDDHVTRRDRHIDARLASEPGGGAAAVDAQHLVRGAVEVVEREDAVAPRGRPAVGGEQGFEDGGGIVIRQRDRPAVEQQGQRGIV